MEDVPIFKRRISRKRYSIFYTISFLLIMSSIRLIFEDNTVFSFAIMPTILAVIIIKATEIHRLGHKYELNKRSVVHTRGYITSHSRRIDLFAISDIIVTQSVLQRLLNFGDIHIRLFSIESTNILKNISHPRKFAQQIEEYMHLARIGAQQKTDQQVVEILE